MACWLFGPEQRVSFTKTSSIDCWRQWLKEKNKRCSRGARTLYYSHPVRVAFQANDLFILRSYDSRTISLRQHTVNFLRFQRPIQKLQDQPPTNQLFHPNGQSIPCPNPHNRKQCQVRGQPGLLYMSREMRYSIAWDWTHGTWSKASVRSHCGVWSKSSFPHLA